MFSLHKKRPDPPIDQHVLSMAAPPGCRWDTGHRACRQTGKEYAMSNANSSRPTPNVVSLSEPLRVRVLAEDEAAPERLHWALRASFRALLPRAWLQARERRVWGAS
jgi:hypothetical protein